jgi:hypothetical protein
VTDYAYWEACLRGEKPEIGVDDPQCGYYKVRYASSNPFVPVAIWRGADGLQCKVGYNTLYNMKDPNATWTWCADKAIPYEVYLVCAQTHVWPEAGDLTVGMLQTIHASEDEGELETMSQQLELARKTLNSPHLDAKRLVDGTCRMIKEQLEAKMQKLKQERAA